MAHAGHIGRIDAALTDLRDLTLVLARVVTDDGERIFFDDVLGAYCLIRADGH